MKHFFLDNTRIDLFPTLELNIFQLQNEKKVQENNFRRECFFCLLKLKSDKCAFAKGQMFPSLESFMKDTLELKVDLWEFAFFAANKWGLKKWLFISILVLELSDLNFDWLFTSLVIHHHFNDKQNPWLGLSYCQIVSQYLNPLGYKFIQCIWMLQM